MKQQIILFFKSESAAGNIAAGEGSERQSRGPWDTFFMCLEGYFFRDDDTPGAIPVRRTMVDRPDGRYKFL